MSIVGEPTATPYMSHDTIVALSSGALPSGVAVLRLSGPTVRFVIETFCDVLPAARTATLVDLHDRDGTVLDQGLVVFFPGPRSFTGEDVAELHLHGGRAVVTAVLQAICRIPGCRMAEAGEFTRRAFLNGKIDLLKAEATADIIAAETEAQRRFALVNADGRHTIVYAQWRRRIIHARAIVEAELDFSDEADVPGSLSDAVWTDVASMAEEIRRHIGGFRKAEIVQTGYRVVLLGAPNAGKSSLLNALAQREAAIVTDEPGTTRDAIDVTLDLRGLKIVVTDTAGIRDAQNKAEAIGVTRSTEKAALADLVLIVEDMSDPRPFDRPHITGAVLTVGTKIDLAANRTGHGYDLALSTVTGEGVDALLDELGRCATASAPGQSDILPWKIRHVELLTSAAGYLERALASIQLPIELRCEELRGAGDAIGRIAGHVDVEDLLDVIFSSFCIGK